MQSAGGGSKGTAREAAGAAAGRGSSGGRTRSATSVLLPGRPSTAAEVGEKRKCGAAPGAEDAGGSLVTRWRSEGERRRRSSSFPRAAAVRRRHGGLCGWRGRSALRRWRMRRLNFCSRVYLHVLPLARRHGEARRELVLLRWWGATTGGCGGTEGLLTGEVHQACRSSGGTRRLHRERLCLVGLPLCRPVRMGACELCGLVVGLIGTGIHVAPWHRGMLPLLLYQGRLRTAVLRRRIWPEVGCCCIEMLVGAQNRELRAQLRCIGVLEIAGSEPARVTASRERPVAERPAADCEAGTGVSVSTITAITSCWLPRPRAECADAAGQMSGRGWWQ